MHLFRGLVHKFSHILRCWELGLNVHIWRVATVQAVTGGHNISGHPLVPGALCDPVVLLGTLKGQGDYRRIYKGSN